MEIQKLYKLFTQSTGVTTDTRKITKGSIFFALKGANFNGNEFAVEALSKGALAAVVDEKIESNSDDLVLVGDVLSSLQELARYYRDQFDIPIIGLTGSNGKTTTKELIASVLKTTLKIHYTKGNFNNHIGVPLTLLAMPLDTKVAIIEMGANHIGEIHGLCKIANPNYGLITNIGSAHLEGFGSLEGVLKGKSELFNHIKKVNGIFFYNEEDPVLRTLASQYPNSISYKSPQCYKDSITLSFQYESQKITTKLFGDYNIANASAAIAIGEYFKFSDQNIKTGLESYLPENNRSQIVKTDHATIILDAYNANPSSMIKSIQSFDTLEGSKLAVIGSMKELGEYEKKKHQDLIDFLESTTIEKIILVGHEFKNLKYSQKFEPVLNIELLNQAQFLKESQSFDYMLIKGSRSNRLELLFLTN